MTSGPPYDYKYDNYIASHVDVFKHIVLCACIKELQKVHPEGLIIIDCFCGDGVYDLNECANRNSIQYRKGILKLLQKHEGDPNKTPPVVVDFIKLLYKSTGCTNKDDLDVYPGSPVYEQNLLRKNNLDELRLIDYYLDGVDWITDQSIFQQLDSYCPSTMPYLMKNDTNNKHQIYLLDPPYDNSCTNIADYDYSQTKALASRILDSNPYATIIILIPYIQNHRLRFTYHKAIRELGKEKAKTGRYFTSININKDNMQGCGILICNPTSTFDDIITDDVVHYIANAMHQGKDEYLVEQIMKKKKSK